MFQELLDSELRYPLHSDSNFTLILSRSEFRFATMTKLILKLGVVVSLLCFLEAMNCIPTKAANRPLLRPLQQKRAQEFNLQSGRQWWLVEINQKAYQGKKGRRLPFIQFNMADSVAYGFSGCNSFQCPLILDVSGNYRFGIAQNTLLDCMEGHIESAFMLGLEKTVKLRLEGTELMLLNKQDLPLLKFRLTNTQ